MPTPRPAIPMASEGNEQIIASASPPGTVENAATRVISAMAVYLLPKWTG